MNNPFTTHPKSIGESYWQHFVFAIFVGLNMIVGGLIFIVHAFFPFVFLKTGSNFLLKMTGKFICRMPTTDDRIMRISKYINDKNVTECQK